MEYILPAEWFEHQNGYVLFLLMIGGLYALRYGAEWLVEGASGLASSFGMPEVIVGATIVSLGTTAPECAVSVMAAFNGNAGLALGNAVGSVIADSALIFGIGCMMVALPADKFVLNRQGWVQIGSAILLAALCYGSYAYSGNDATINRPMGIGLLVLLAFYLYISVVWSKQHPQEKAVRVTEHIAENAEPGQEVDLVPDVKQETHEAKHSLGFMVGQAIVGLLVVIASGHVAIESVTVLAERIGIPDVVIAATLVAIGTSLPELVVGLTAVRKGHPELLVGNVLGADILNILFVTGAAASASPLPIISEGAKIPEIFLYIHLPAMLIILTYFRICITSATRTGYFQRWMGLPLVISYFVYAIVSVVISI